MTLHVTQAEALHMTRRTQLEDGRWQTICSCGWHSSPAAHPDLLGWTCHVKAFYPPIPTPESIAHAKAYRDAARKRLQVETGCRIAEDGTVTWPTIDRA